MSRFVSGEAALDVAIGSAGDKFLVVDFTASWCGPCKSIAPLYEELASQYAGQGVFLKVDVDSNRALVQRFGVQGFPTFVFLRRGRELDRLSGADPQGLTRLCASAAIVPPPPEPVSPFSFPLRSLLCFDQGNPPKIVAYLLSKSNGRLLPAEETKLKALGSNLDASEAGVVCKLFLTMFKWEEEYHFAVLDLVRLLLVRADGARSIHLMQGTPLAVWPTILTFASQVPSVDASRQIIARHAVALECVANGLLHPDLRSSILEMIASALVLPGSLNGIDERTAVATVSVIVNVAMVAWQTRSQRWADWCAAKILPLLMFEPDQISSVASTRLLGAIGTLIWLAHVQGTKKDSVWDCESAMLLSSVALPTQSPVTAELQKAFELPMQ